MNENENLIVEKTFKVAIQNQSNNNLLIAKNLYNKILEINPKHQNSLHNLGIIFQDLGEFQKAKNCIKKIIDINPNFEEAHNTLGVIYKKLRSNQKAIDCFKKATELNPNYEVPIYNLGTVFQELENYHEAIDCFEKVIKINYNYVFAHNNLGNSFNELGEYHKAIESYKKAIELNPNYERALYNLGVVFQDLGEFNKAINFYQKSILINPNYLDAHNNLGTVFQKLREYQKAKNCFEKVIELYPDNVDGYINLGVIFKNLGEFNKEINCYKKIIEIDPDNQLFINLLMSALSSFKFDNRLTEEIIDIKNLFLFLYRKNVINHENIFKNTKIFLFSIKEQYQLQEAIDSNKLLKDKILQRLLKDELFHLILQKSVIADRFLEKLLTTIRHEILFNFKTFNKKTLKDYFNFTISLAEQSWLNEYINTLSDAEVNEVNKLKNKIENNDQINEFEITILGSYIPLNSSVNIINKLLNYKSSNNLFNDLISIQIIEPLKEKELIKSIKSLDTIDNITSKNVRKQYEENPYPRWRFTNKYPSLDFWHWLNLDIKPNRINKNNKFLESNTLIAGCGTGNHSISATRYKNTKILAIDLSLKSLGYAKRKTDELNYKNIEYLHADILQLNKLNKKFDIIECVGTLHHMKEPLEGLKILLNILEPHGFLKLGLYSEIARKHYVKARKSIKKKSFVNSDENIKIIREQILNEKKDPLIKSIANSGSDFYSTSAVRDLLFHVQEHRFTIPKISKILNNFDLEFLGFSFYDDNIKRRYFKNFPDDKNNIFLQNWHEFELKNPNTFIQMYQFWVRKN